MGKTTVLTYFNRNNNGGSSVFDRSGFKKCLDAPHAATASRRQTRSGVHSCDVTRIRFVRRTCPVACVRCDNYRGSSVFDRSGLNTSLDAPHAATASRWQNALRCTFLRRYEDAFRSQAVACSVRTAQFNFLNENITQAHNGKTRLRANAGELSGRRTCYLVSVTLRRCGRNDAVGDAIAVWRNLRDWG